MQTAVLVTWTVRERKPARTIVSTLLLATAGLGLLMTASRGAWAALLAAGTAWYAVRWYWRSATARKDSNAGLAPVSAQSWQLSLGPLLLAGSMTLALAVTLSPTVSALSSIHLPAAAAGRLALTQNSLDLALDYPFTGLGLAGFPMAYSSYVLLVHVEHTVHAHNLFLNTWLEQGLPGLLCLLWLLIVSARVGWRGGRAGVQQPALASVIVMVLHGMVDDAFYGSRGLLLMFVPFGVLAFEQKRHSTAIPGERAAGMCHQAAPQAVAADPWSWLIAMALVAGILLQPVVRAAFRANLGTLAQTRAELSVYRWPDWPIQDAARRAPAVDLLPAIIDYRAALALDARNASANRRLGQLALSLGQYSVAQQYLERAYAAAPAQRATRQLLGEAYAATGDTANATNVWQTVDNGANQLEYREWWHSSLGEGDIAKRIALAAAAAQQVTREYP